MPQRIALIAFKFPPYAQVGARRWTKLAKYLARQGVEIDVFAANWGDGEQGLADVDHPNIHIHRVPCPGLHRLWYARFDRHTIRGRIGWFVERVLNRFVQSWPVFEEARLWRRVVGSTSRVIVDRQITTLVVTGAPFWAVHWASRVKARHPDVRLIVDYRDPWTDLPGLSSLAARRRQRMIDMELAALRSADTVVAVSQGLGEIVNAKLPGLDVRTIRNGCDPEEIPESVGTVGVPRSPILIHAGNIFAGRERPFAALLGTISEHQNDFPELRFVFYGGVPNDLVRQHAALVEAGTIQFRERITASQLMIEYQHAFACLHFNAEAFPFALSTKVFEHACMRRPTLSVNYGGELSRLIEVDGLGWNARADDPEDIRRSLRRVRDAWLESPGQQLDDVNTSYGYPAIAEQWRELIGDVES